MNPFIEYIDKIDLSKSKKILLLFRGGLVAKTEILPILDKIGKRKATLVLEDSAEIGLIGAILKLQGKSKNIDIHTFDDYVSGSLDKQIKKSFCIMNPTFGSKGLKMIDKALGLSNRVIYVHPSNYLLDKKGRTKLYNDVKSKLENHTKDIVMFNGNPVFNIRKYDPCAIVNYDKSYNSDADISYLGHHYIENIWNITVFNDSWVNFGLDKFLQKMKLQTENENVWTLKTDNLSRKTKYYCHIASVRGDHCNHPEVIHRDNFYTVTKPAIKENFGTTNRYNKTSPNVYAFNSNKERINFINYCNTFFVRFCVALLKNNQHLDKDVLSIIPIVDFKEAWDDEKVFDHFKVTKKLRKYIMNFLPDYYNKNA